MNRLTVAILPLLFCLPLTASTSSFTYSTNFLTDANQPASATATFSYNTNSPNTLTITLTDTTPNPISDAPSLADLSFTLPNATSLTDLAATGASGATISSIVFNHAITTGNYDSSSPWTLASANNGWWGTYSAFDFYAPACTPGPSCNDAPYAIVGPPSTSNGEYDYTGGDMGPGSTPIGSANYLDKVDGPMFYQTATFTLNLTGLTQADFNGLANVVFGFGPDGPNNPDGDDISKGTLALTATPEPSSMALMALALSLLMLTGWRRVNSAVQPGPHSEKLVDPPAL